MKTVNTNSKLAFAKNSLVELNDDQLQDVNGGSVVALSIAVSVAVVTYLAS
ncbi:MULTISPECIES: class I lanthipeptide [Flavobacterium]|mgnify:FL=1|uniref:class I lanthipeptide n=1 Tax=Flavobacterium TaxID=237 RepID=UPI0015AE5E3B|nr:MULTISPECIES: class I lanthipeptide [Flavobacterium]MBN9283343.1 class I lanthipeptide [Flavobacterium sp.]MBN9283344.1 class I lanthipeptide [Flavobacterium sp.]MBN9283345.1 class I lanthipeptide [Flavobacterium sp.]